MPGEPSGPASVRSPACVRSAASRWGARTACLAADYRGFRSPSDAAVTIGGVTPSRAVRIEVPRWVQLVALPLSLLLLWTVAGAVRPAFRRWVKKAVFALGVLACALGLHYGVATLLPGVAALVSARFIWPRGVRGVD